MLFTQYRIDSLPVEFSEHKMLDIDNHVIIHELLDHEAEGNTVLQNVVAIYLSTHHDSEVCHPRY